MFVFVWYMFDRCSVYCWYIFGICLVYVWYMFGIFRFSCFCYLFIIIYLLFIVCFFYCLCVSLLMAANVSTNTVVTNNSCFDPRTEDPESWECDCFEDFKRKCEQIEDSGALTSIYAIETCLRAIMCNIPNICPNYVVYFMVDFMVYNNN